MQRIPVTDNRFEVLWHNAELNAKKIERRVIGKGNILCSICYRSKSVVVITIDDVTASMLYHDACYVMREIDGKKFLDEIESKNNPGSLLDIIIQRYPIPGTVNVLHDDLKEYPTKWVKKWMKGRGHRRGPCFIALSDDEISRYYDYLIDCGGYFWLTDRANTIHHLISKDRDSYPASFR